MTPARNILAIYDAATKQLLRYVIPDFEEQTDDPSFWSSFRGEASIKIPVAEYMRFGSNISRGIQDFISRHV